MFETLSGLVNQIETFQTTLTSVEAELNALDAERLAQAVAIAKKGLPFARIWATEARHSCNNCYHSPKHTYHDAKGVMVAKTDSNTWDNDGGEDDETELWLLDDGTWAVTHCTGSWSRWQGAWSSWERTEPEALADPIAAGWDVDYIVRGIVKALERRLERLGERVQAQQKRLEKIRALEVK